jgi:hypothetical protein
MMGDDFISFAEYWSIRSSIVEGAYILHMVEYSTSYLLTSIVKNYKQCQLTSPFLSGIPLDLL